MPNLQVIKWCATNYQQWTLSFWELLCLVSNPALLCWWVKTQMGKTHWNEFDPTVLFVIGHKGSLFYVWSFWGRVQFQILLLLQICEWQIKQWFLKTSTHPTTGAYSRMDGTLLQVCCTALHYIVKEFLIVLVAFCYRHRWWIKAWQYRYRAHWQQRNHTVKAL